MLIGNRPSIECSLVIINKKSLDLWACPRYYSKVIQKVYHFDCFEERDALTVTSPQLT